MELRKNSEESESEAMAGRQVGRVGEEAQEQKTNERGAIRKEREEKRGKRRKDTKEREKGRRKGK